MGQTNCYAPGPHAKDDTFGAKKGVEKHKKKRKKGVSGRPKQVNDISNGAKDDG